MKINSALITAAGFGTRMGPIGKKLPKVLWPIFEKTLIELQIDYLKRFGIENIFINIHFKHEKIKDFIEKKYPQDNITLLHEQDILGSGGAVHNLAYNISDTTKGSALILNSDQFLFFKMSDFDEQFLQQATGKATLLGCHVNSSLGHNQVIQDDKMIMKDIIKNASLERDLKILTFSGLSLIKLDQLTLQKGPSEYFNSVANYKNESVKIIPLPETQYYDFGTLELYKNTIFKIFETIINEDQTDPLYDFLMESNAIQLDNISSNKIYKNNFLEINLENRIIKTSYGPL